MPAIAKENQGNNDQDHGNRGGFDPQHKSSGDFDVAPGNPGGNCGDENSQKHGRESVAGGIAEQEYAVMVKTSDDAGAGGDVSKEKAPGGDGRERRRERQGGVGIERTGGSRQARVVSDRESHEKNRGGRQ